MFKRQISSIRSLAVAIFLASMSILVAAASVLADGGGAPFPK